MFKKYNHFLMSEEPSALGGGTGGAPVVPETNATSPVESAPAAIVIPDNWKDSIAEEFRNDSNMSHIKSVEDMAKSYINAQKHMGSDKIVVPGQYATDDDWAGVFSKLGRPETAEGYEVSLSEGSKLSPESLSDLKAKAHEVGILPAQLKALVEYQESQLISSEASFNDAIKNRLNGAVDTLKAEWGTEYETRLSTAANMVKEFGGEDLQNYLNETGYGNDPQLVKTFYKIAQGMGEGRFEGDSTATGSGNTPETAKAKIKEMELNEAFMDKRHPQHDKLMKDRSALFPMAYPELAES